jgi:hypothetical protein
MGAPQTTTGGPHESGWYEIRLKGHLDARWAAWFDGLALTREDDGTTCIRGPVIDQAALHGLLQRVRDLGLPLLTVMQVAPQPPNGPENDADTAPPLAHEETTP